MSDYAVVNPATGETLATYPTITDDALESASSFLMASTSDSRSLLKGFLSPR